MTSEPPYLFVSYASADRERVLPVVDRLEEAGVKTWVDREGIHGGANYAQVINDAVKNAVALLLFASPASLASRNVRQEIALGWRYEKPYLPLLLAPVEIPDELAYWLEGSQWIELLDRPEAEWLRDLARALKPLGIVPRLAPDRPVPVRERPLLVGREREQAVLRQQLDRMLAGNGGVVLVGGEAGIGKTTLVEDLSVEAEAAGALVLWGHAYDLSVTPPYGPWLEILHEYQSRPTSLPPAPAFIGNAEELAKVGSQETLFADVAGFLVDVAARRPLVLVIDDLHWVDQASLDFFRYLARRLASQRILLVATYRSDELHRRHPLYTLLPLLVREADAARLEVRPLDQTGHRALIRSRYVLPEADQERLERYLQEHAEGNPLYAGELLRSLEEEAVLVRAGESWQLGDLEQVRVPPLLRQVIDGRVARFDEESQRLLGVAAVIGQSVPLGLWAQVGEVDEDRLLDVAEHAEEEQVLTGSPQGNEVRFRHALIREALYEGIPSLRRRRLHRQVGEALAATSSPDPNMVAYHFQQAGDARAAVWLIRAAHQAGSAFALRAAAEGYEAAQALLERDASQAELRGWLLYRLAFTRRFAAPADSLTYLDEVAEVAAEVENPTMRVVAEAERGFVHYMTGTVGESLRELTSAIADYDAMPAEQWAAGAAGFAAVFPADAQAKRLTAERYLEVMMESRRQSIVNSLTYLGYLHQALGLAERFWPRWQAVADSVNATDRTVAEVINALGGTATAYATLGDPDEAETRWQQSVDLCLATHNYVVAGSNLLASLCWLHLPYHTDDLAERRRLQASVKQQYQQAVDYGNTTLPPADLFDYSLMFLEGAWHQAEQAATTIASTTIHPWIPSLARCILGLLAYRRGDAAAAWKRVSAMLPDGSRTEPGEQLFLESQLLQRLAAALALDAHDLPTVRAWLEAHDRWLDWSAAVLGRAESTLLWGQYHHASGDTALARQSAEQALAYASDPRQPLALLAVHRFLGGLDTEAQQFDAAEEYLRQSLQLAEACAAPFERALTLLGVAHLRAAQGKVEEAHTLLAEVRVICEPLGAKPTLERISALEGQLGVKQGADDA